MRNFSYSVLFFGAHFLHLFKLFRDLLHFLNIHGGPSENLEDRREGLGVPWNGLGDIFLLENMKYLFILIFFESERYSCVVPWRPFFFKSLSHKDKRKAFPKFFCAVLGLSRSIRKAVNCLLFQHQNNFSVKSKQRRQAGDRLL